MRVPLFPLSTVLFPFGHLSLRIFEPRYIAMISDCMKNDEAFGVVLILNGNEAGKPATYHSKGTLAKIEDFDQLDDGNLGISCTGTSRFKVLDSSVQPDNLIVADITLFESEAEIPVSAVPDSLSAFVNRLWASEDFAAYRDRTEPQWHNPEWISYQAAELLPLSMDSRQLFLEMTAENRLAELALVIDEVERRGLIV